MNNASSENNNNFDSVPLPGSERLPYSGSPQSATGVSPHKSAELNQALDSQNIQVSVYVRRAQEVPTSAISANSSPANSSPANISAANMAKFGASPADLTLVASTLSSLGAKVDSEDAATRCVKVSGPAPVLAHIFGTELTPLASSDEGTLHRERTGSLSVPKALDGVVTAVLGLDDRPTSHAQFRLAPAAANSISYSPLDLGTIYQFPESLDGSGTTIAIIELGGGFDTADLTTYFKELGIKMPTVQAVSVDGAKNVPLGDPNGADGEVLLDIEVAGALAPGADLLVYFAPNTDAGFVDAISQAVHASPTPAAVSISWGQSEDQWTQQARETMDAAFVDAAMLGITVCVAAGDNGSADNETDGKNHVDFPASSPHALACGGTRLNADPQSGKVSSETVWNDGTNSSTGGGVSDTFPLPDWQKSVQATLTGGKGATPTGRGVPDVAGVADPQTGYKVRVDGKDMVIGGTSAVAPLWAALVARLAQSKGKGLGLLQPALYGSAAPLRDITVGNNGNYEATPAWDACTGLGVPQGQALLDWLSKN